MATLAREFAEEMLHWEGRLPRTLLLLLRYPGRLTEDYLNGRRARYIAPPRLFLATSFAFFGIYLLSRSVVAAYTGAAPTDAGELARVMARALLVAVPLLALGLKLLYLRSGRPLIHHLIYACHITAAALLIGLLTLLVAVAYTLLGRTEGAARFAAGGIYPMGMLACCVYLFLSLRRVYPEPLRWGIAKFLLLLVFAWLVLIASPLLVFGVAQLL